MKKIIISTILLLAIVISLASCNFVTKTENDPVFEQINTLLEKANENYTIEISLTNSKSQTITETYVATTEENGNTTINYTVERLGKFTVTNGNVVAPSSYKTVYTGYAVVNQGNLFELSGDKVDVDFTKVVIPSFNLTTTSLENAALNEGTLTADVKSQSEFLGTEYTSEPMQLEVVFTENGVQSVTLTFKTAAENDAVVVYTFN